jgi:hypothetical protein
MVSCQLHAPAALPTGKSPRYSLDRRLGGPHSRSRGGGEEKTSLPVPSLPRRGNEHRSSRPQTSHCNDWARPGLRKKVGTLTVFLIHKSQSPIQQRTWRSLSQKRILTAACNFYLSACIEILVYKNVVTSPHEMVVRQIKKNTLC